MNYRLLLILLPNITVYLSFLTVKFLSCSSFTKTSDMTTIPYQPPPIVFQIIWPILLLCLGLSWYQSKISSIFWSLYTVLVLLLSSWLFVYLCLRNDIISIIILLSSIISSLTLIIYFWKGKKKLSSALLFPLLLWLLFALYLSSYKIFIE